MEIFQHDSSIEWGLLDMGAVTPPLAHKDFADIYFLFYNLDEKKVSD